MPLPSTHPYELMKHYKIIRNGLLHPSVNNTTDALKSMHDLDQANIVVITKKQFDDLIKIRKLYNDIE